MQKISLFCVSDDNRENKGYSYLPSPAETVAQEKKTLPLTLSGPSHQPGIYFYTDILYLLYKAPVVSQLHSPCGVGWQIQASRQKSALPGGGSLLSLDTRIVPPSSSAAAQIYACHKNRGRLKME